MSDNQSNNKRIAKNTIYLYFRTLVVMVVSLYTSRVILQALGIEDFGIYNVVGGITAMISFVNGTLADATQRYITFELGKGSSGNIGKIYSTCMILHVGIALVIALLLEPIGIWFINNELQIPDARLTASMWVYQFMIIQLFISFISVPFNALIIAYEKMSAFAMISIVEVFIRLIIAFSTMYCGKLDHLIVYGFMMMVTQALLIGIYIVYCKTNFKAAKFNYVIESPLIKEMGGFAIWTVIGNLAWVCVTQGLNLLLGVFFQPTVNAARGIAVQVQSAVNTFVRNFQTAINPQITKKYAAGNLEEMHTLIFRSSRLSFFLMMMPLIPIMMDADLILKLWLKSVPDYTTVFIRLILLVSWFNTLGNPLGIGAKASGKIKTYELYVASIKLLVIPISYIALKYGAEPYSVFVVYLIFELIALAVNLFVTHNLIHFSLKIYFKECTLKLIPPTIITLIVPICLSFVMPANFIRLLIDVAATGIIGLAAIYSFGLSKDEKSFVINKINNFKKTT